MKFTPIDVAHWKRRDYFEHYLSNLPCTYSITVKLDITPLVQAHIRLYPAMLYCITAVVNRHEEFRTALDENGLPGVFDEMIPCYTVFHKETETFSSLWTEPAPSYAEFLRRYEEDLLQYGHLEGLLPKPGTPANTFPVSMMPWTSFEGFNLNLQKGYQFLLPIFTMGKYEQAGERILLPLAMQVHHAVCDGFHTGRFLQELQEEIFRLHA